MRVRTWLVGLSVWLWVGGVSLVHAGHNVWTSLGPAGVSVITALAIDPSTPTTLYAGAAIRGGRLNAGLAGVGVYKSTDGGSSWFAGNTGLSNTPLVTALAIDPLTPT